MPWFLIPLLVWGVVVIVGTYKRWSFFLNDSSLEALTKRYGREYAIMYSYLVGAGMIVISMFGWVAYFYGPK